MAGIAGRVVGITPDETERFSAHPYPGHAAQDEVAVQGVECLKALRQADLTEIRRTLGSSRFGQVSTLLGPGHDLAIGMKL